MAKVLTDKAVKNATAAQARREIPDARVPGLYLVVQPSGSKSWAVRYRAQGKPCKLTLGPVLEARTEPLEGPVPYGIARTLAEAREAAREALLKVGQGANPAAEKKAGRNPAIAERDLFRSVVEEFLKRHASKLRTHDEIKRLLEREVIPHWGERRVQDITKRDVNELLDGIQDRSRARGSGKIGPMANRVFSAVRKLFKWAIERDIVTASPCAGISPPVEEKSRDRILTDDEVRWFWKACEKQGEPFGHHFKLLLLTGQRLSEVTGIADAELNLPAKLWTIPKERAKNDKTHDVPLSDAALDVLAAVTRWKGRAGLYFTTKGDTPVSGFSRAKASLDAAMLEIAREETGDEELEIPGWRLHDLRRTVASGMARLGIALPVIEKALNHSSGSFAGIVGVYQRHSFADEKRQALDAWARFVASIVEPSKGDNVLPLRRGA